MSVVNLAARSAHRCSGPRADRPFPGGEPTRPNRCPGRHSHYPEDQLLNSEAVCSGSISS